jgi:hypothetical protein
MNLINRLTSLKSIYARNNNQILALKLFKKAIGVKLNYAISVLNPSNLGLNDELLITKKQLSSAYLYEPPFGQNPKNSPQWYKDEYLVTVSQVLIDTTTGIAFTNPRNPIAVFESSNILPIEVSEIVRPRAPKKVKSGNWVVLSSRSYAHWLIQDLPRFLKLVMLHEKQLQISISNTAPRYVVEVLDILGIAPKQLTQVLYAEKYTFVSAQYAEGLPSSADIEILHKFRDEKVKNQVTLRKDMSSITPEKVYISRRYSARSLPNEIEIERLAIENNFMVVYLEEWKLDDEIEMFRNVELIVGAAGAGLCNIVWADQDRCKQVVEIYDDTFLSHALEDLACRVGINFSRVRYQDVLHSGVFLSKPLR